MPEQVNSGAPGLPPGLTLEIGEKLLEAATSDSKFYAAFLKDPKAAYQARFGEELLPGEKIEVRHMPDGGATIYLPKYKQGLAVPKDFGELSDDMLAMVSGGNKGYGTPPPGQKGGPPTP